MVDGVNGFGQGDKQIRCFSPTGYSVKSYNLASLRYRYEDSSPEDKNAQEEFQKALEKTNVKPEPAVYDISLLTAPPQ